MPKGLSELVSARYRPILTAVTNLPVGTVFLRPHSETLDPLGLQAAASGGRRCVHCCPKLQDRFLTEIPY